MWNKNNISFVMSSQLKPNNLSLLFGVTPNLEMAIKGPI